MKSTNILKSIIYGFILLIQSSLIISVFIINNLTSKKAGVMRHVYSRRLQYKQGIYSKDLLSKQGLLGILLAILFSLLLIYAIKNHKSLFLKFQIMLGTVISILLPIVINSNYFIDMMAYPYFVMAFELVLLIQIIVVIILVSKEKLHIKCGRI